MQKSNRVSDCQIYNRFVMQSQSLPFARRPDVEYRPPKMKSGA